VKKSFVVLVLMLLIDAIWPAPSLSASAFGGCFPQGVACWEGIDCVDACNQCCFESGQGYATSWACCDADQGPGFCFCTCIEGPPPPPPPGCWY